MVLPEQILPIRLMCFDVDGVLTDGGIIYSSSGEELKSFHVRDGFGLVQLAKAGIQTAIITGRSSEVVARRAQELRFTHCFQGVKDKKALAERLLQESGLSWENVGHMGDDLPDLELLEKVGLACCPQDAVPEVQSVCHVVTKQLGGRGAAREVCELLLSHVNQAIA